MGTQTPRCTGRTTRVTTVSAAARERQEISARGAKGTLTHIGYAVGRCAGGSEDPERRIRAGEPGEPPDATARRKDLPGIGSPVRIEGRFGTAPVENGRIRLRQTGSGLSGRGPLRPDPGQLTRCPPSYRFRRRCYIRPMATREPGPLAGVVSETAAGARLVFVPSRVRAVGFAIGSSILLPVWIAAPLLLAFLFVILLTDSPAAWALLWIVVGLTVLAVAGSSWARRGWRRRRSGGSSSGPGRIRRRSRSRHSSVRRGSPWPIWSASSSSSGSGWGNGSRSQSCWTGAADGRPSASRSTPPRCPGWTRGYCSSG